MFLFILSSFYGVFLQDIDLNCDAFIFPCLFIQIFSLFSPIYFLLPPPPKWTVCPHLTLT